MFIDRLMDSHGPSRDDLKVLERLGRHRRAFEAVKPADQHQATVREHLLELLDQMEETLVEEGRSAPALVEGWQRVDQLEARFWETAGAAAAVSSPAAGPEARLAANDSIDNRRAA